MPRKSKRPERDVYVSGSKFSKAFMQRAALDFQAGRVKDVGQIILPDGLAIKAGPAYRTTMSQELQQLIKAGILQASNFGIR